MSFRCMKDMLQHYSAIRIAQSGTIRASNRARDPYGNGALFPMLSATRRGYMKDNYMHCAVIYVQDKGRFEKGGCRYELLGYARRSGSYSSVPTFTNIHHRLA